MVSGSSEQGHLGVVTASTTHSVACNCMLSVHPRPKACACDGMLRCFQFVNASLCRLPRAELEEAAAAGIPISPSLSGPHAEEQTTQMEVFFKQYKYPEHKCFIL